MRRGERQIASTRDLIVEQGDTSIAVASTATVRTDGIEVWQGWDRSLWVKATSATGTPDIKVDYEVAYVEDDLATESAYVTPDAGGAIDAQINDENLHVYAFDPPPCGKVKIVITGINANPADTIVSVLRMTMALAEG